MFAVTMLGCRGSTPSCGEDYFVYGGDTTCILIRAGGRCLLLDAGTGMGQVMPYLQDRYFLDSPLDILISHSHLDHILGFTAAPLIFFRSEKPLTIYGAHREGMSMRQQIEAMMRPPLWPVTPSIFAAGPMYFDMPGEINLGDVRIHTLEGNHPGGCTMFRIEHAGKSVVFTGDYEHSAEHAPLLADFARNCDMLIYDAHFTDGDYVEGWGHSTWQEGERVGELCGAGRVILTHHHPARTDAQLDSLQAKAKRAHFAKARETYHL